MSKIKLTAEEKAKVEMIAYERFHEQYEINADFTCKEELDEAFQEVLKEATKDYIALKLDCKDKEDHSSWE